MRKFRRVLQNLSILGFLIVVLSTKNLYISTGVFVISILFTSIVYGLIAAGIRRYHLRS